MSLTDFSEEVDMLDTTTSAHINRAFLSSTGNPSTGTDGLASSLIRPIQEGSHQFVPGVGAENVNTDLRALAGSIGSGATNVLDTTTGPNLDPEVFFQTHHHSDSSPVTRASISADADYFLDTSDWLLENEFFDMVDFRSLQPGQQDVQFAHESDAPPHVRDLRDVWYVPVAKNDTDPGPSASIASSQQATDLRGGIDEAYRADMATKLLPLVRTEPLPSIDLLVSDLAPSQSGHVVSQACRTFASVSTSHVLI